MTNMRRIRRLAVAAASVAMALGASGCAYFNPMQTHEFYRAADGISTTLTTTEGMAGIHLRNAQLIVDDEGRAELYAYLSNTTDQQQSVTLAATAADGSTILNQTVQLPAGEGVTIGPDGDETIGQDSTTATPGDNAAMTVSGDGIEQQEITLPVADTSLGYTGSGASDGG